MGGSIKLHKHVTRMWEECKAEDYWFLQCCHTWLRHEFTDPGMGQGSSELFSEHPNKEVK